MIIDWYIQKYWGKDYIRKTEIAQHLAKAKENEAERWKAIIEEEKAYALEIQEEEFRMEMAELQAECIRLQKTIKDSKEQKKSMERAEIENKKNSRKNLIISSEIKDTITRFLNSTGEVQGLFDRVTRTAQKQVAYLNKLPSITEEDRVDE